jgi:capsular exopolysaccharide synthesis family protein
MSDLSAVSRETNRSPASVTERVFDLGEFLRLISRRKTPIIAFVVACCIAAVIILQSITPIYTGVAEVLIQVRQHNITDIKAVFTEELTDKAAITSEIEVLRSRGLAEQVADQLKILQDPEFNPALQPPSPVARLKDSIRNLLLAHLPAGAVAALGLAPEPPLSQDEELRLQRQAAIDNFMDRLSVLPKGESRVIIVSFDSVSAEKAARVANAFADTYILDQLDQKYEATRRANTWLSGKLDELRKKVAVSEGAVVGFRRQAGLIQGQQGDLLVSQQISELNGQLIIARSERAAAEARLGQVRELIRSSGGADAAREAVDSPIIVALVAQETETKRKVAELQQEYGERHPRLVNAKAELRDVQAKLTSEVAKIVKTLENEAGIVRARESALQRALQQLESRVSQANTSGVQLRALEREADADKSLLEQFLTRSEQINAQTDFGIQQANARIISRANVPLFPSAPQKTLLLVLTFVASAILAVLCVLLVEMLHRGFRSGEQIEELTGVRALGLIPMMRGSRRKGREPEMMLVKHPSSLFGESVRSLYTSILISQNQTPPKTILVTSSFPKEGKTTLSACLARMCAMSGKRTVIVEADLRKPQVHKRLGVPQGPGLVEYFLGETDLSQVFYRDEVSGVYVIPSGKTSIDATKLLDSPEMGQLLAGLSAQFDLVILDTPPIMAVADARVLAPQVDGVVFAVRWARTQREVVTLALKKLKDSGARLIGAVLTQVDVEQHAQYGYGDSGYYHKGIKSYYHH